MHILIDITVVLHSKHSNLVDENFNLVGVYDQVHSTAHRSLISSLQIYKQSIPIQHMYRPPPIFGRLQFGYFTYTCTLK